jgi:hypothetical protein
MFKSIGNNGPLFQGINKDYINADNSHNSANFSSNQIPTSSRVLSEPASNVQAAAAYIPGCQKGGKNPINRKKINKISRKYKMHKKSRSRHMKSRLRSRFMKRSRSNRRTAKRNRNNRRSRSRSFRQRGGHSQYQNNMPVSNTYSLGGNLSPSLVGMANPPPISSVTNQAIDNLNHNALNAYGKSGAGMGTPSKGW